MSTLAEIFAKYPPHTDAELDTLIDSLRGSRHKFVLTGKSPTAKPKTEKQKEIATLVDSLDLKGMDL